MSNSTQKKTVKDYGNNRTLSALKIVLLPRKNNLIEPLRFDVFSAKLSLSLFTLMV